MADWRVVDDRAVDALVLTRQSVSARDAVCVRAALTEDVSALECAAELGIVDDAVAVVVEHVSAVLRGARVHVLVSVVAVRAVVHVAWWWYRAQGARVVQVAVTVAVRIGIPHPERHTERLAVDRDAAVSFRTAAGVDRLAAHLRRLAGLDVRADRLARDEVADIVAVVVEAIADLLCRVHGSFARAPLALRRAILYSPLADADSGRPASRRRIALLALHECGVGDARAAVVGLPVAVVVEAIALLRRAGVDVLVAVIAGRVVCYPAIGAVPHFSGDAQVAVPVIVRVFVAGGDAEQEQPRLGRLGLTGSPAGVFGQSSFVLQMPSLSTSRQSSHQEELSPDSQ